MFLDSLPNTKKYLNNFQAKENPAKIFPNSYSKLVNIKEPYSSTNPVQLQRTVLVKGASPLAAFYNYSEKGQITPAKNKPSTPSTYSIRSFNYNKGSGQQRRPISVGSNGVRPGFLEPEVTVNHYPNKSVFIGIQQPGLQKRNNEGSEPYKFPLFRTKQIKGFKLSISPEVSESDQSFMSVKTPLAVNEVKNGVIYKAPYTSMNKKIRGFVSQIGWGLK